MNNVYFSTILVSFTETLFNFSAKLIHFLPKIQ